MTPRSRLPIHAAILLGLLPLGAGPAHAGEVGRARSPAVSDEERLTDAMRAAARIKQHEAMALLQDMLERLPATDPRRPEMMFRLAELVAEEARALHMDEVEALTEGGGRAEDYIQQSPRWWARAVALYTEVLDRYPGYARADDTTYALAAALSELGRHEEATRRRVELVRSWPDSPRAPETYVLIGEHYFEHDEVFKALQAYSRAASHRDSEWRAFALYKLAWCHYNLEGAEKAAVTMESAIAASVPGAARMDLREEAMKDLVRFLAESGEVEDARAVLTRLGRADLLPTMLARMGEIQAEQGRYEAAVRTWRTALSESPASPSAPQVQSQVFATLHQRMGRGREALDALELAAKAYGPGSAWAGANPDRVEAARETLEKDLRGFAVSSHELARKVGTGPSAEEAWALAHRAYGRYLELFPQGEHGADVRFAYAELLYKLKRYDEAYNQYMAVVAIDPKGEHARFCAEAAIFAAEKMGEGRPAPTRGLSEADKALIAACDQLATLFPDGPKAKTALYKSAYRLYERSELQAASERFQRVIALDPRSTEAEQAANLILDAFALAGDWEGLERTARAFRDQPGLGSAAFKADVARIYENASLKRVETRYADTREHKAAGDAYWAFYQEFPDAANADLALNNAAAHYQRARETGRAMAAREALIARFPSSRFYVDQVALLAYDYESIADFGQAAHLYERLFQLDPRHPSAREALYSAALFRKVMGDWRAAIGDYQRFVATYADDPRVPDVRLLVGRLQEDHAQWADASTAYAAFFQAPPAGATTDQVLFARLRYGLVQERLFAPAAKIERHWDETVALFRAERARGTPMTDGPDLAAEVLRHRLEPTLARYRALRLDGPTDEAVRRAFEARLAALQDLERGLQEIVETGSGQWGLAALVELGAAYEDMALALAQSPVPSRLSPEQRLIYTDLRSDKVAAMNQKAADVYELCLARSFELSLYNENTTASLQRLRVLDPVEHPPLEESVLTAGFTSAGGTRASFVEEP